MLNQSSIEDSFKMFAGLEMGDYKLCYHKRVLRKKQPKIQKQFKLLKLLSQETEKPGSKANVELTEKRQLLRLEYYIL